MTSAVDDRDALVYLNNRYLDPTLRSFVSVDPLVVSTGEAYIYGAANPITYSDPTGLDPDTAGWVRERVEANGGCTYSSGYQCFDDKYVGGQTHQKAIANQRKKLRARSMPLHSATARTWWWVPRYRPPTGADLPLAPPRWRRITSSTATLRRSRS